jgi:hypothetical protein
MPWQEAPTMKLQRMAAWPGRSTLGVHLKRASARCALKGSSLRSMSPIRQGSSKLCCRRLIAECIGPARHSPDASVPHWAYRAQTFPARVTSVRSCAGALVLDRGN